MKFVLAERLLAEFVLVRSKVLLDALFDRRSVRLLFLVGGDECREDCFSSLQIARARALTRNFSSRCAARCPNRTVAIHERSLAAYGQFQLVDPAIGRVPPEEKRRPWGRHDTKIVLMVRTRRQASYVSC